MDLWQWSLARPKMATHRRPSYTLVWRPAMHTHFQGRSWRPASRGLDSPGESHRGCITSCSPLIESMRHHRPNHALQRTGGVPSRLQSARLAAAVAELGSLERMNSRRCAQTALALGIFAPAACAHQNIGLPMIAVFPLPLWVALSSIALLEGAVVSKRAKGCHLRGSVGAMALANVASTIVGVPVLWFLLAIAQLVCCGAELSLGSALDETITVTIQAP